MFLFDEATGRLLWCGPYGIDDESHVRINRVDSNPLNLNVANSK